MVRLLPVLLAGILSVAFAPGTAFAGTAEIGEVGLRDGPSQAQRRAWLQPRWQRARSGQQGPSGGGGDVLGGLLLGGALIGGSVAALLGAQHAKQAEMYELRTGLMVLGIGLLVPVVVFLCWGCFSQLAKLFAPPMSWAARTDPSRPPPTLDPAVPGNRQALGLRPW